MCVFVCVCVLVRYNRLLGAIKQSLNDLLKALKGLVVMSQQLEDMANSLFINQVPSMWASKVSFGGGGNYNEYYLIKRGW